MARVPYVEREDMNMDGDTMREGILKESRIHRNGVPVSKNIVRMNKEFKIPEINHHNFKNFPFWTF